MLPLRQPAIASRQAAGSRRRKLLRAFVTWFTEGAGAGLL